MHPWIGEGRFCNATLESGVPPLTLHDLRDAAASLAIRSGANVKAVQRMLGHASAAMTLNVYAHPFDNDPDAAAIRLDEDLERTSVRKVWACANLGVEKSSPKA